MPRKGLLAITLLFLAPLLFLSIPSCWTAEEESIEKVCSGQLAGDRLFLTDVEAIPGKYLYRMTRRNDGR